MEASTWWLLLYCGLALLAGMGLLWWFVFRSSTPSRRLVTRPPTDSQRQSVLDRTLERFFDQLDTDADGRLSLSEIAEGCRDQLGVQGEDFEHTLAVFDEDGSGTISRAEFLDVFKRISTVRRGQIGDREFALELNRQWGL